MLLAFPASYSRSQVLPTVVQSFLKPGLSAPNRVAQHRLLRRVGMAKRALHMLKECQSGRGPHLQQRPWVTACLRVHEACKGHRKGQWQPHERE